MTQARLIQAASLGPEDRALCLPSGNGYVCAILSLLVSQVHGIETREALANKSSETLEKLGITNTHIHSQNALTPPKSIGLFKAIIIEGAIEETPTELFSLLSEGGSLLSVLAGKDNLGHITQWNKLNGQMGRQLLNETPQYVLPEFSRQRAFAFV